MKVVKLAANPLQPFRDIVDSNLKQLFTIKNHTGILDFGCLHFSNSHWHMQQLNRYTVEKKYCYSSFDVDLEFVYTC